MDAMEVLKAAAERSGVPITHIGRTKGFADNYVNKSLYRGSIPKTDTMAWMLEVCGYSLCAVPNDLVTDDMLVITDESEKKEGR